MRTSCLRLGLCGLVLALMGGAIGASTATAAPTRAATRRSAPNVVLIISDDQGWGDYGFMGHPHIQTPNLDRLAKQSLTFRRGYVPSSLCRPSLATIITGLYPHQHGITGNDPIGPKNNALPAYAARRRKLIARIDDVPTLPRLLNQKGYLSMQSGKWWQGKYTRGGFTNGMTLGFGNHPRGRHGDLGLTIGREGMKPVFDFMDDAKKQGKPFFLWYAPFLPHLPHNPPPRLVKKYRGIAPSDSIARYWAMCEWFDETCGQLMDYLDRNGLADNTIVLYVCDNGWIQHPKGERYDHRSKRSPYEGGVRTPIMIRWPGRIQPRMDDQTLASSIDLAPTILSACGLKPTRDMPGVNLLDASALQKRQAVFGAIYSHDIADVDHPTKSLQYRWVIEGSWKLIEPWRANVPDAKTELYHLADDPNEQHDLASANPAMFGRLKNRINAWWLGPDPALAPATVTAAEADAENGPMNVLFFLSDDQRNDMLGCAGHPIVKTPNIDRMAHQGVRFANAFVTTSICAASRATMFTGLYERTHGYTFGKLPVSRAYAMASYPALLKKAGYRTGFIGKYGVKMHAKPRTELFDTFVPINHPYFHKQPDGTMRHETELDGDQAVQFLRTVKKGQPFCLSVSFNAVHAEDGDKNNQYPVPKAVAGLYDAVTIPRDPLDTMAIFNRHPDFLKQSLNRVRYFWRWDTDAKWQKNARNYFAMITGLDRVIGRVLAELEAQGLADRTVVVFAGDNGYYMGARGFAGKWSHYEQSLRIPLVIYDPRLPKDQRGRVIDAMALNVDLPATFLDYAHLAVPQHYEGRSLKPLVRGQTPTDWRTDFFCEHLMENPQLPKWEGVRNERYKYARYFDYHYEYLHDLKTDPKELKNFVHDPNYKSILEQMRRRCDALRDSYGGPYVSRQKPR